jgi:hypothetical protein
VPQNFEIRRSTETAGESSTQNHSNQTAFERQLLLEHSSPDSSSDISRAKLQSKKQELDQRQTALRREHASIDTAWVKKCQGIEKKLDNYDTQIQSIEHDLISLTHAYPLRPSHFHNIQQPLEVGSNLLAQKNATQQALEIYKQTPEYRQYLSDKNQIDLRFNNYEKSQNLLNKEYAKYNADVLTLGN